MEKKGNILSQLAILSDLLENANMESTKTTVTYELNKSEFTRLYNIMYVNSKEKTKLPKNRFQITIGLITFVFNMNNV